MTIATVPTSSLDSPAVAQTLARLRAAAKGDRWVFIKAAPSIVAGVLTEKN